MRYGCLVSAIVLALASVSLRASMPLALQTTVKAQPDEDLETDCRYELTIPLPEKPVKAVWVIFERSRDMLRFYGESTVQDFARQQQWALLYAFHCPAKGFTAPRERGDINPEPGRGQGRALFAALDQFSVAARHPELASVRVVLLGFSGTGGLVARFPAYAPNRVAAVIAANAGHFDPFGIERVTLSSEAAKVPQLVVVGAQDRISGVQRPYDYFRRHFDRGAPWTFLVQNGTPHCCVENVRSLILEWLQAVVVNGVRVDRGVYGFISRGPSGTVDCQEPFPSATNAIWCRGGHDEWNEPNWSVAAASLRQTRDVPEGMLPSGWLPTRHFADAWRAFVTQPAHPISSLL